MYYDPVKSYLIIKVLTYTFTFLLASGDPHNEIIMDRSPATALSVRVKTAVLDVKLVPSSAVSYALSLRGHGVSVGIVQLGSGGGGWLQPLHAANYPLPLLLWTSRKSSPVPQWMEGQAAYVITADSLGRIRHFLEYDTHDALTVEGTVLKDINITNRDFQIHSSVPVIMAVERKVSRYRLQIMKREILLLFRVLWRRHQSFHGLLIVQRSEGLWRGFVMDPLKKKREQTLYESTVDKAVASVQTQVALRTQDLGGYKIVFFFDDAYMIRIPLKRYNGHEPLYHPYMKLILYLRKLLDFSIKYHDQMLEIKEKGEFTLHYIAAELAEGTLQFCVKQFSLHKESLNFDILQATTVQTEMIVLFPIPDFLPAWSLPFRVFGLNLWLSLVVCMVAYALAWRVVANEPLAASAAAALRALSSCGGTPQDRVRSTAQRLMLAGALLASAVVVAAAYQGRLYTLQVNPERYQGFKTLEEIVINGLPLRSSYYWYLHNGVHVYKNKKGIVKNQDDLNQNIKSNVEDVRRIIERRNAGEIFAWLLSNNDWKTLEGIVNIDGWSILSHSEEKSKTFMHARRNWPWTYLFNRIILQMLESGLMLHWYQDYDVALKLFYNSRKHDFNLGIYSKEDTLNMPFKFGLKDVWALFNVLGIGLVLGTVVFVIEIRLGLMQVKLTKK